MIVPLYKHEGSEAALRDWQLEPDSSDAAPGPGLAWSGLVSADTLRVSSSWLTKLTSSSVEIPEARLAQQGGRDAPRWCQAKLIWTWHTT